MILPRNPRINDANNMNRLPIMGTTKLCVRDIVLALVVSVTRLMNRIDPPSAQNRKILPFINYSVHKFQKSPNDPGSGYIGNRTKPRGFLRELKKLYVKLPFYIDMAEPRLKFPLKFHLFHGFLRSGF